MFCHLAIGEAKETIQMIQHVRNRSDLVQIPIIVIGDQWDYSVMNECFAAGIQVC